MRNSKKNMADVFAGIPCVCGIDTVLTRSITDTDLADQAIGTISKTIVTRTIVRSIRKRGSLTFMRSSLAKVGMAMERSVARSRFSCSIV